MMTTSHLGPPAKQRPSIAAILTSMVFVLLLVAPLTGHLLGRSAVDDIRDREFRNPAPVPGWPTSANEVRSAPGAIDAYFDDHFGFRIPLGTLDSTVRVLLGGSGSDRVIRGADGWLFANNPGHVDAHRGAVRWSDAQLDKWIRRMENRRKWLNARSIEFILVMYPTKAEVYPEFLPTWARASGPTTLDSLKERIRRDTDIRFIDLKPAVLEAKARKEHLLFFKTDTHWSGRGMILGYEAIIDEIRKTHPTTLRAEEGVHYVFVPGEGPKGLRRMVNTPLAPPEVMQDSVRALPAPHLLAGQELINGEWIDCKPSWVGWALDPPSLAVSTLGEGPRVLIFRDSFTIGIHSLFKQSFSAVLFANQDQNALDQSLVEFFDPDVVVFSMIDNAFLDMPRFTNQTTTDDSATMGPAFSDGFEGGGLDAWGSGGRP